MEKIIKKFKKNKLAATLIAVSVFMLSFAIVHSVKGTYSLTAKYVVFRGVGPGANDEKIITACKIGADGKLDSSCVDPLGTVCGAWSKEKHPGYFVDDVCHRTDYGDGVSPAQLKEMTFSDSDTYYCVGCTSRSGYYWGCYVCDANSSIMQWVVSAQPSDSNCPNNQWHKDNSITDARECQPPEIEPACYECKADEHVMKWSTDDSADSKCTGGYKKTDKPKSECKTVTPACYVCSTDDHVMKWDYDGKADDKCSDSYTKTNKSMEECSYTPPTPQDACYKCKDGSVWLWGDEDYASEKCNGKYDKVTTATTSKQCVPPYACYECKTDTNIVKWSFTGTGDNSCPGGYNKTDKPQAECKTIIPENPTTGSPATIFSILAAIASIVCSCWYLKKSA